MLNHMQIHLSNNELLKFHLKFINKINRKIKIKFTISLTFIFSASITKNAKMATKSGNLLGIIREAHSGSVLEVK